MEKIIYILTVISLIIIILLNLLFTSCLNTEEHIEIDGNKFIYIIGILSLSLLLYFLSTYINRNKKNFEKHTVFIAFGIFILFNIIWCIIVNPKVTGDSVHVCNLAQVFYRNDSENLLYNLTYLGIPLSEYMQSYHQQISLAFIFSIFFRIIHFDMMESLRILNIISNFLIVLALYKITIKLSKKYEINKLLLFVLVFTFIPLSLLSTFIYGDIPSIALCLFSVYFMIEYKETKHVKYYIIATFFSMFAYMMRMNSLIFIIATLIYLLLNLQEKYKQVNFCKNMLYILLIILYIIFSIVPSVLINNYYLNKYNLDKTKASPTIRYILMAMEESPRANGWYNEEIALPAIINPEIAKQEYRQKVYYRLIYFSHNLDYTFNFYIMKIASMWTENTYSSIRNNTISDTSLIKNTIAILTFYQKTLLILICTCSLINLIKNKKKLSLEIIFLITIFIGGFTFHILWEAKSRYIIPYILILMPLASIKFQISKN